MRLLPIATVLVGLGASPAAAVCPTFITPDVMTKSQFRETDFGTLGLARRTRDRIIVFGETSCYDISGLELASIQLLFNNTDPNERPSFLAAAVVRTFDYKMRNEPNFQIKFRRNANADDAKSKWVRVDDDQKLPEGTRFNGSSAIILQGEFDPIEKIEFATLPELLDFAGMTDMKDPMQSWHAVIVELSDPAIRTLPPNSAHKVIENTIFGINAVGMKGMEVVEPQGGTTIAQMQFVKFQRLAQPARPVPALDISIGGANCVYIRYRVDGGQDPLIKQGNTEDDYLVLKTKADAAC